MRCFQVRRRLTNYVERIGPASEMTEITRHIESCPDCARRVSDQHRVKALLYRISDVEVDPFLRTQVMAKLRAACHPSNILSLAGHPGGVDMRPSLFRRPRYLVSMAAVLLVTLTTIAWYALSMQSAPTMTLEARESDDMTFYLKEHALHADQSVFSGGAFGAVMVNNSRKH